MIRRLKYDEIDWGKYQKCLETSEQRIYSAEKIFLDVTANKNWEILVYNDYEAVMPIPYATKNRIKFVHNPKLCQQLGVFSKEDNAELNTQFVTFLLENFLVRYYAFNESNKFSVEIKTRKNYVISADCYENVYKKYSPKRKRKLRVNEPFSEIYSIKNDVELPLAKNFMLNNMVGINSENEVKKYVNILLRLYQEKKIEFFGFYLDEKLANLIAIYLGEESVALLGTFNDKEFIKVNGASCLINEAIKKHVENKNFDFEGSEIPSIEAFFKGFSPELKHYSFLETSKKDLIIKLLTQRKKIIYV